MRRLLLALVLVAFGFPSPAGAEEPSAADPAPAAAPAAAPPPAPTTSPSRASVFSPHGSLSDEELAYEYQHTSLGGPIALTVIGGSVTIFALPVFLSSGIAALVCSANQLTDCSPVDTVVVVSGVSTAIFGTMTVAGVIWLANRSHERSALKNEIWRRQSQGASLGLRLAPTVGGSMLILGGQF